MARRLRRFRPAVPEDVEAVLRLMAAYYMEEGYPFVTARARELIDWFVQSPELGRLWVAEVGDDTVGYLAVTLGFSFEHGGRDAFIDELYIATPFRGAGLGREAIACAEAYCRRNEVRAIHLEVETHRTQASSLYASTGYTESGRRLMSKRLAFRN